MSNPLDQGLLTGTHVVSFSGGRTSAFMVAQMEFYRRFLGADIRYVFMDTGAEHPKTYEFIKRVVKEWGIPLICFRAIINPSLGIGPRCNFISVDEIGYDLSTWRDMTAKHGLPYVIGGFCTSRLKQEPHEYMMKTYFPNATTWIGIRADEPKRLRPKPGFRYLAEIADEDKPEILSWWNKQPFNLEIEEHLGNCVFCVKKTNLKIALAMRDEPELLRDWIEMIDRKEVRLEGRTQMAAERRLYRNRKTVQDVMNDFAEFSRDELAMRVRVTKAHDTGSCTESCEVFNGE